MSTTYTAADYERVLAGDRILFGASDTNLDQRICRAALRIAARVAKPGVIEMAIAMQPLDKGTAALSENIRSALTEDGNG